MNHCALHIFHLLYCLDVREIGDMDESVVEGGEDACYTEDELACDSLC